MIQATFAPPTSTTAPPQWVSASDPVVVGAGPDEQVFVIPRVNYRTYVTVCDAFPDRNVWMTFDGENLTFMGKSRSHERLSRVLGKIIGVLTEELDIPMSSSGSMTCRNEQAERGAEPDESYYIANESEIRGNWDLDLDHGPHPDLLVEVDLSSSSRGRLPLYAKLGIPEVWRYFQGAVQIYALQPDQSYVLVEQSPALPFATCERLTEWIARAQQLDDTSFVRELRRAIHKLIAAQAGQ